MERGGDVGVREDGLFGGWIVRGNPVLNIRGASDEGVLLSLTGGEAVLGEVGEAEVEELEEGTIFWVADVRFLVLREEDLVSFDGALEGGVDVAVLLGGLGDTRTLEGVK